MSLRSPFQPGIRLLEIIKYIESEFEFVIEELTMPSFRDAIQAGTFPAIEAFLSRNAKRPDQELGNIPGWMIVIVRKLFGRTSDL